MPTPIPKNIHFSSAAELTAGDVQTIEIWAESNKNYNVKVWIDRDSVFYQFLYNEFFKIKKEEFASSIASKDTSEQIHYSICKSIYQVMNAYRKVISKNPELEGEEGFSRGLKLYTVWSNISDSYEKLRVEQTAYLKRLNNYQNIETVKFSKDDDLSEKLENFYTRTSDRADIKQAETIIGLSALNKHGGVYIEKNILPKLKTSYTSEVTSGIEFITKEPEYRGYIETIINQEVLKKLSTDGTIANNAFLDNDIYHSSVQIKNKFKLDQLKERVQTGTTEDIFSPLGDIDIDDSSALLGNNGSGNVQKSIFIASHKEPDLVKKVFDEANFLYDILIDDEPLKGDKLDIALRNHYIKNNVSIEEWEINRIRRALPFLYDNIYKKDLHGDIIGIGALERYARTQTNGNVIAKDFSDYSANTPQSFIPIKNSNLTLKTLFPSFNYNGLIYITTGDDADLIESIRNKFHAHKVEKSVLYYWNSDQSKLIRIEGSPFIADELTKVIIAGHGTTKRDLSPKEEVLVKEHKIDPSRFTDSVSYISAGPMAEIVAKVIPQNVKIKKISFHCCSLANKLMGDGGIYSASDSSYIPDFLRSLSKKGRSTQSLSAYNERVFFAAGANKFFSLPKIEISKSGHSYHHGNMVYKKTTEFKDVRKAAFTRYNYHLLDNGLVSYSAKLGFSSFDPEFKSKDVRLSDDENIYPNLILKKEQTELSRGQKSKLIIISDKLNADIFKLAVGITSYSRLVLASKNKESIDGLIRILQYTYSAKNYDDWIMRVVSRYPGIVDDIKKTFDTYTDKYDAYDLLKDRVHDHNLFEFYHVDALTDDGAGLIRINHPNIFNNIELATENITCRPRRSVGNNSCSTKTKKQVTALKLLSGTNTQLYLDSSKTDIALLDTNENSQLADFQKRYTDFRRQEGKAELKNHKGFHNFIALDEDSFSDTQTMAREAGGQAKAFLLKATVSAGPVLLSPEGGVKSAIEGGENNDITVLGKSETLSADVLATIVADFTPEGKIDQLTVTGINIDGLAENSNSLTALKSLVTAPGGGYQVDKLIIQPLDGSQDSLKRLTQHFESIQPDSRQSVDTIAIRSGSSADPEYRLFPGESNALQVSRTSTSTPLSRSVLPGSFIKLPELDNPPDASESLPEKVDDKPSDILTIAATRSELRQRLLEFDMAFMAIRDKHNLADDVVPVLDSLTREGDGWRMDFMQPDSGTKTSIAFESGAFHRFKTFISDVQNGGTQRSGKSRQTGGMDAAQTFADLPDMIEGFVTLGSKQHKRARPAGMTDAQYRTYLGRQYLFYIAMAVQGAELVDLGAKGVKLLIPSFKKLAPGLGQTGLPSSLSSIRKLSKAFKAVGKSARFIPILGFSTQLANLSLTIDAYLSEKDPDVKKLLEAQLIFDSIDTAVSGLSEFAGPAAYPIDFVMYLARDIFDSIYGEKFKQLRFEKVRDASKAAAKTFNSLYAALDPDNFIAKRANSINFLVDGSGKNRLPINVKEVNLVDSTFRFGAVYSYKQTYIPGPHEWKYCTRQQYHGRNHSGKWCREYDNKIEYSDQFDMVSNALKTLCKTENRLRTYQCADGVFKKC